MGDEARTAQIRAYIAAVKNLTKLINLEADPPIHMILIVPVMDGIFRMSNLPEETAREILSDLVENDKNGIDRPKPN